MASVAMRVTQQVFDSSNGYPVLRIVDTGEPRTFAEAVQSVGPPPCEAGCPHRDECAAEEKACGQFAQYVARSSNWQRRTQKEHQKRPSKILFRSIYGDDEAVGTGYIPIEDEVLETVLTTLRRRGELVREIERTSFKAIAEKFDDVSAKGVAGFATGRYPLLKLSDEDRELIRGLIAANRAAVAELRKCNARTLGYDSDCRVTASTPSLGSMGCWFENSFKQRREQ